MSHPQVNKFIEEYEREALLKGSYRKSIGRLERLFLETVWGPAMGFDFTGLKAEYPFKEHQVEKRPQICQRQLKQAIGHWWTITQPQGGSNSQDVNIWGHRRQLVIQAGVRRGGKLRPAELAAEFGMSNRSASLWLKRFAADGTFTPPSLGKRATIYVLTHYATE